MLLTGLLPNTNYFYRALSRAGGITNLSAADSFSTAGEIIIDNAGAALAGTWTTASSSVDKFGSDYVFASTAAAFSTATYTPNLATPGAYDIYIWYPQGANRPTNAPYQLVFDGGTLAGTVNQTTGGGGWRLIAANTPFVRGTGGYFQWQNSLAESGKVVLADAVRFVYATNQEPPAPGGVPRWWGEFFFGGAVNAALDPDGDGATTAQEYLAGTDPLRASSHLRYRLEDRTGNTLRLSFDPFHAGRVYELQSEAVLSTNGWTTASTTPQTLPNGGGVFTVTNLAGTQKFYRLRVQLPP